MVNLLSPRRRSLALGYRRATARQRRPLDQRRYRVRRRSVCRRRGRRSRPSPSPASRRRPSPSSRRPPRKRPACAAWLAHDPASGGRLGGAARSASGRRRRGRAPRRSVARGPIRPAGRSPAATATPSARRVAALRAAGGVRRRLRRRPGRRSAGMGACARPGSAERSAGERGLRIPAVTVIGQGGSRTSTSSTRSGGSPSDSRPASCPPNCCSRRHRPRGGRGDAQRVGSRRRATLARCCGPRAMRAARGRAVRSRALLPATHLLHRQRPKLAAARCRRLGAALAGDRQERREP